MLPAIHPTGDFIQHRLAPATDDESCQSARERHESGDSQRPKGQRQNMPGADEEESKHRPDEQALP